MNDTKVICESQNYYGWGNTETTAADQVALMRKFAYGDNNGVLGRDARNYGNKLMQGVQPDQRFGITCGPWGNTCDPPNWANPVDGVTVSLKNGWKTLPTCTDPIPQCPWQVNSTGSVQGQGRDYVLSVLTTKDPVGTGDLYGFNYGIETIQGVSRSSGRTWAERSACALRRARRSSSGASSASTSKSSSRVHTTRSWTIAVAAMIASIASRRRRRARAAAIRAARGSATYSSNGSAMNDALAPSSRAASRDGPWSSRA